MKPIELIALQNLENEVKGITEVAYEKDEKKLPALMPTVRQHLKKIQTLIKAIYDNNDNP